MMLLGTYLCGKSSSQQCLMNVVKSQELLPHCHINRTGMTGSYQLGALLELSISAIVNKKSSKLSGNPRKIEGKI